MYCLNIALGNVAWRLLFKNENTAGQAHAILRASQPVDKVALEDDFGQHCTCFMSHVHGYMLEDLDKTKLAHCELFLHQKRTENAAVKMAQSDPGLRAASMGNSPAIINPMGNGARPF